MEMIIGNKSLLWFTYRVWVCQ